MQPIYSSIDPQVLLKSVDGDLESFSSLSQTYLRIAPPMLAEIKSALARRDCKAVMRASHSLKGSAALVGAAQLAQAAGEVENAAAANDAEAATQAWQPLADAFSRVMLDVRDSIDRIGGASQDDGDAGNS